MTTRMMMMFATGSFLETWLNRRIRVDRSKMQKPWRQRTMCDEQPPKRRTQSSSAELQPSGPRRRLRLLAKDRYRIVVMGSAAVGKTCIISRLLYERFVSEYEATVEELHSGDYELDGRPLTLDILDTSGTAPHPLRLRLTSSHISC